LEKAKGAGDFEQKSSADEERRILYGDRGNGDRTKIQDKLEKFAEFQPQKT
jgi:hypothetical protein